MKILFYDTKKYDKESFDKVLPKYETLKSNTLIVIFP